MHLSTSRTSFDNLCFVSLISLSWILIVLAIFKLVYIASNSLRLFSTCFISSSFSARSCFNQAFSRVNSSCKYIKCLSLASKVLNSFLSSSVILYQNCTQIYRIESKQENILKGIYQSRPKKLFLSLLQLLFYVFLSVYFFSVLYERICQVVPIAMASNIIFNQR